ncbi:MAG: thiamine pyrophosphate-dependent dehydrogenase E1 component subunit alpha [Pirellulales bacterium]|nr:thiamine pyrophosphate-dependent dehydrogenase E1 component subunit alpha [Pirellulales bacterium]
METQGYTKADHRLPLSMSAARPLRDSPSGVVATNDEALDADCCRDIFRHMVRARAMEERLIQMSKSGMGFFWIGGPGEEAFNVCLGMQVRKGCGPAYDYLHLHYRNSGLLMPMGLDLIEGVRQMLMRATDVNSMGRNFVSHYARRHANVVPVTSVLEVQYAMAPGTAIVQKRHGGDGVTIVVGGDAGTAEGDFASCLLWSSRPENELPVLVIVMNNHWGISTPYSSVYRDHTLIERGRAFGVEGEVVDGNDPVASWHAIERGLAHCRSQRRPYMIEARVSRLYGHSSASGAMRVENEPDPIAMFQHRMLAVGAIDRETIDRIHNETQAELDAAVEQALREPEPTADDLHQHTFAPSNVDQVYPNDFTGLPA